MRSLWAWIVGDVFLDATDGARNRVAASFSGSVECDSLGAVIGRVGTGSFSRSTERVDLFGADVEDARDLLCGVDVWSSVGLSAS